jgi:hypothetical protein
LNPLLGGSIVTDGSVSFPLALGDDQDNLVLAATLVAYPLLLPFRVFLILKTQGVRMRRSFKLLLAALVLALSPSMAKADVKIQDGLGLSNYDLVVKFKDNRMYLGECENFGQRNCRPYGNVEGYSIEKARSAAKLAYYGYRGVMVGTGMAAVGVVSMIALIESCSIYGIIIDLAALDIGDAAIGTVIAAVGGGNLLLAREALTDLIESSVDTFNSTKALKQATQPQDTVIKVRNFKLVRQDLERILSSAN